MAKCKRGKIWVSGLYAVFLTAGCMQPERDLGALPEVHIERLDQDIFRTHPDSFHAGSLRLYAQYGEFYRTYVEDILRAAPMDHPRLPTVLAQFATDSDWLLAQAAVDSIFGDMAPQEEEFAEAFAYLRSYLPNAQVPRIVAYHAGYNFGIFPTDSVLGVGVEWFIGPEHEVIGFLAQESFPRYLKRHMHPKMLVPSGMRGWLMVHYLKDATGQDLLTHMVEAGKVMALLRDVLPNTADTLLFACTSDQLRWCEENEFPVWQQLVRDELLFSKKREDVGRMMNDGPFTNGFPHESPGHLGEWIGYRMVRSYQERNPKVSYSELFALPDASSVLRAYKPRK
jgi:hypothetical protein